MSKKKPKSWPIKVAPILIDVYGKHIHFCPSYKDFNEAMLFMGRDADVEGGASMAGFTHTFNMEDGAGIYYFVCVNDGQLETLVHELCHACLNLIDNLGFSAHDGNGEPFCYMMDYMISKTYPLMAKP